MSETLADHLSWSEEDSVVDWKAASGPLLTIVTIVYNEAESLRRTIESVSAQTFPDIEYIVVDGGSSDGTVGVIEEHEDAIDRWISEPDEGIADAFNKGIAMASGRWINLLNAGDLVASADGVETLVPHLRNTDRRILTTFVSSGRTRLPKRRLRNDMSLSRRARISHQGSFVRREVYAEYGLYRKELNYRMDLDFWLRVLQAEPFYFVEEVYCNYEGGGVSAVNHVPMIMEGHRVEADHLSKIEFAFALLRSMASNAIRVPYHWVRRRLESS
jgi:glycosyltransferase involved in cell wall biosynthesis